METFECINIPQANEHLAQGAQHLSNDNLADFIAQAKHDQPVLVICYHGNSSKGAAQFLLQGFSDVYSIDGGVDAWRSQHRLRPAAFD